MTPEHPRLDLDTEEPCIVPGCGQPSERRLALAEARRAFPELLEAGRRAPLCRDHYRQWKKETKQIRRLDRLAR